MEHFYRFEDFTVDIDQKLLTRAGTSIALTPKVFETLLILLEKSGRIVEKRELMDRLWPDTFVEETNLTFNIQQLRKALGDSAREPHFIETVQRRGYRFIAPVEEISTAPTTVAQPQPGPPTIGEKISHYRVLQVLGGGGMGVVHKAEDLKLGRSVAVKFLPADVAGDPIAFERMQREARAASALDHPNICSIHELGEHNGFPFIVMQFLEGQTLREWIEQTAVKSSKSRVRQCLDIAIQVSSGLEAAHEKGIIHRDIKPANIFVTTRGEAKILDFGVAKFLSLGSEPDATSSSELAGFDNPSLTLTGASVGTPSYLSPEQIEGHELDTRTDLFSFGLVLYEMVSGLRAFCGNSTSEIRTAVLRDTPAPVRQLKPDLPEELERVLTKALLKERDLRYQTAAEMRRDLEQLQRVLEEKSSDTGQANKGDVLIPAERSGMTRSVGLLIAIAAVAIATVIFGGIRYSSRPSGGLTEKDTIVLGDFTNTTGDPVFDDTLKQGLSVQLEQSPFLALISDHKVNETLKLMGRAPGDRLTPEVAREVCLRTSSKAMLSGTISSLGSEYVIGLKAINCDNGAILAELQEDAGDKEAVLTALDSAAVTMRTKLGESLSTVQKYSMPLREATTTSFEALRTYSIAMRTDTTSGAAAALPFLLRTIELDPNFAEAYASVSASYGELNQPSRAEEYARKAFDLRKNASEVERFAIETNYYELAIREPEKAAETCELWRQNYPRDARPVRDLAYMYATMGKHEKALETAHEAMQLGPRTSGYYVVLGRECANLNRFDEAQAVYGDSETRQLQDETLWLARYQLAFVTDDTPRLSQLVTNAAEVHGTEALLLTAQSDTEAWHGRLAHAQDLLNRAISYAMHQDAKETAAIYRAEGAITEAEAGNVQAARAGALAAIKLAPNRDSRYLAAIALARAGDNNAAEKLVAELEQAYPKDTLVQRYWLPTIHAALALNRKAPDQAIQVLETAKDLELSTDYLTAVDVFLCPAYLRGEAYLMQHDGYHAAAEFQKFVEYRGLVGNFPWGAMARLGLARAYAAAGDRAKAASAYNEFLTLWKDADPNVPVLLQAKSEYATIKGS